jgi:hypothetical protein
VCAGGVAGELGLPRGQRDEEGRQQRIADQNRAGSLRTMHRSTMSHGGDGRAVGTPAGRWEAL